MQIQGEENMVDNGVVVLYPSPNRGHLYSMIELGKLMLKHLPSISITIIIISTVSDHQPIPLSADPYLAAAGPSITFIHLPAVVSLPSSSPSDVVASFFELPQLNNPNLKKTLLRISESTYIRALVLDFFCNAAVQVSSSLNIPTYYYMTSGANGLCGFLYIPALHEKIERSLEDLDDIILDMPGMPSVSSKDMPSTLRDRSHRVYRYFMETAEEMAKSAGLILNTFESLEPGAVEAVIDGKCTPYEPTVPPIYCVGPIVTRNQSQETQDCECLRWLDSQPKRSVLFLCFGSAGVFSAKQLKEMAGGLERSGVRFLWVVRNPPENDRTGEASTLEEPNLDSIMPEDFLGRTRDRGLVVKVWAPQVAVLSHDSVGGFVTHCGWNSIMEAVSAGVPMLAWPLYSEQKLNRVVLVEALKAGLRLEEDEGGFVSATELELRISELMESEKGKVVRRRVEALREMAAEAWSEGGTSRVAMRKLVDMFRGY